MKPEDTTTKQEYQKAIDDEQAEIRHYELETMRTRAVNPNAVRYAETQLYREFGEGDLVGQFSS